MFTGKVLMFTFMEPRMEGDKKTTAFDSASHQICKEELEKLLSQKREKKNEESSVGQFEGMINFKGMMQETDSKNSISQEELNKLLKR